jgi:hypothetical protein
MQPLQWQILGGLQDYKDRDNEAGSSKDSDASSSIEKVNEGPKCRRCNVCVLDS